MLLGRDIANLLATSNTVVEKLTVLLEFCENQNENEIEEISESEQEDKGKSEQEGSEQEEQKQERTQRAMERREGAARKFFEDFKKEMAKAPIKTLKLTVRLSCVQKKASATNLHRYRICWTRTGLFLTNL